MRPASTKEPTSEFAVPITSVEPDDVIANDDVVNSSVSLPYTTPTTVDINPPNEPDDIAYTVAFPARDVVGELLYPKETAATMSLAMATLYPNIS